MLLIQKEVIWMGSKPLINVLTKRAMGFWCVHGWLESWDRGLRPELAATRKPLSLPTKL